MSRCRILKQTLVMVLTVMLIAAGIPLGAAAAEPAKTIHVNRNGLTDITASKGELTTWNRVTFTDTLAYNASGMETIKIGLEGDYDRVSYIVDEGRTQVASAEGGTAKISFPTDSEEVLFVLTGGNGAKTSGEFTLHVVKPNASNITTLSSAFLTVTAGGKEKTVKGLVNNTAKTISVELPWGCTSGTVTAVMNYPGAVPVSAEIELKDENAVSVSVPVVAQNGSTTSYTINAVSTPCVTGISVNGVQASVYEKSYTVLLPKGTAFKGNKMELSLAVADQYTAEMKYVPASGAGAVSFDVEDGGKYEFKAGRPYTLVVYDAADRDFYEEYTVTVAAPGSDSGTAAAEEPKTGKKVVSFVMTSAANADEMTEENTYEAAFSDGRATIVLPYSLSMAGNVPLVPLFKLSEGARLYLAENGKVGSALQSGFEGSALTVSGFRDATLIVADEQAAAELEKSGGKVALKDLKAAPYAGHTAVYKAEVAYALAQTGAELFAFSAAEQAVTSVVSGSSLKITVPASYVDGETFFADYDVSPCASVKAGGVELPGSYGEASVCGEMRVVSLGEGYAIQVSENGTDFETFTKITVTSEDEASQTAYNVTVTAAPAQTGAAVVFAELNGKAASINTDMQTVSAMLPRDADLTAVSVEYRVSDMAAVLELDAVKTEYKDGSVTYDLSEPFHIQITSEMGENVKVYTVSAAVNSGFTDVPDSAWYYGYVMKVVDLGIAGGNGDGTFAPNAAITREEFAKMVSEMLVAAGLAEQEEISAVSTPFDETNMSSWAKPYIAYLAEKGFMRGVGGDEFDPKGTLTREMAATVLCRALKLTGAPDSAFQDQSLASSWAAYAVGACKAAGIFQGDEQGRFNPQGSITRAETAKVLVIAAG